MKESKMLEWLDKESSLRCAVLSDMSFYNKLGRTINKLWHSDMLKVLEPCVKLFTVNSREHYVLFHNEDKQRLFVFSSSSDNVNIDNIKEKSKDPRFVSTFIFSILMADFVEPRSIEYSLSLLDNAIKDKDGMTKVMVREGMKAHFFSCPNYIDNTYRFYDALSKFSGVDVSIVPLYDKSVAGDIDFAQRSLTGLYLKLDKVMSVLTDEPRILHYETMVVDDVLFIQDFDWRYAIKRHGQDVLIVSDLNKSKPKTLIKKINDGKMGIFPYSDTCLKTKNGKVVYADLKQFRMGVIQKINALAYLLEKEGDIEPIEYPEDLNTFNYQLRYQNTLVETSAFNMVIQALLVNGGGFEYNEKAKGFVYHQGVEYVEGLPVVKNDEESVPSISLYTQPKDVLLTPEWINEIEKVVNVLKTKRPLPESHDRNETPDQALDKGIAHCEALLAFNRQ